LTQFFHSSPVSGKHYILQNKSTKGLIYLLLYYKKFKKIHVVETRNLKFIIVCSIIIVLNQLKYKVIEFLMGTKNTWVLHAVNLFCIAICGLQQERQLSL
jgi:hypothetical protein